MKQEIKLILEDGVGATNSHRYDDYARGISKMAEAIMKVVMSRLPSEDRIARTLKESLWMAIPYDPIKKHLAKAIRSDLLKNIGE